MRNEKLHITLPNSTPSEELYRFGADGNLRMYSYDRLFYSLYGYDGGTTRTYKYSFDLNPNWVNGRLENVSFNPHTAMFYPNSYLNFNSNGYYTKHYYNGTERIASRLGDQNLPISTHDPELQDRKDWQDSLIRKNVAEITGYEFLPAGEEQDPDDPKPEFELPQVGVTNLIPNTSSVYYYHPNHLGSTCYVTDGNAIVQQGFLYAPFGEITNEYNNSFGSSVLPKYSFNAKELDEETGMYYYEARYYNPPTFISRDPLFEKYPTFSPYAYCANNPVKYIDPTGEEFDDYFNNKGKYLGSDNAATDNVRIIPQENWDRLKIIDAQGKETIDHEDGFYASVSFSEASNGGMSEKAQLRVYQHYNPTKEKLTKHPKDSPEKRGMTTRGLSNNKIQVIQIRLKGNSSGIKIADHANEIRCLFAHEKGHVDMFYDLGFEKYKNTPLSERERYAIQSEVRSPYWNLVRPEYRLGADKYAREFGIIIEDLIENQ